MEPLEGIPLWDNFSEKATDDQRVTVTRLAHRAADRLDRIIETFPNYTLHNHVHAENVVRLMSDLLGDHVGNLTALEGAILILSAYLHDIGMVFTEEERAGITEEERFPVFLRQNPSAAVQFEQEGALSRHIAEWYCRWAHAERVHGFLAEVEDNAISWGVVQLRKELGKVCESHNWDHNRLWDAKFQTDFLAKADLLFCALILRLADILDFDNSRSPEEVYTYLGLAEPKNRGAEKSQTEWQKHLASDGFKFVRKQEHLELKLIAAPRQPAVEYDVREFLKVIETEIGVCRSLLPNCSQRWHDFALPQRIDTSDIKSTGYKFGEYRFTLDQERILELLMGENLYPNPFVFVRELVQNAIDTSRHREYHERAQGRGGFQAEAIQVRSWEDETGEVWVRVDDYGMGMNDQMVLNYLLKVGVSYYKSSEFEAVVLKYRNQLSEHFVPISRFGIGLLSCFIACDQLELSTRRLDEDDSILRMTMQGLRGFFILHRKAEHHRPKPMPRPRGKTESDYRSRPGTSIAVRLDARKDISGFDLSSILESYILHSPVRVEFWGKQIGGDYSRVIEKSFSEFPIPFSEAQLKLVRARLGQPELQPVLRVVPLDLTANSGTPLLKGQGAFINVEGIPEANSGQVEISVDRFDAPTDRSWVLEVKPRDYGPGVQVKVETPLNHSRRGDAWLSHNGIRVPTVERLSIGGRVANGEWFVQVALRDAFRPDLSVARDHINALSWECLSTLALTIYKCLRLAGVTKFSEHILRERLLKGGTDLVDFEGQLRNIEDWKDEPIIRISRGEFASLNELRLMVDRDIEVPLEENPLPVSERFSRASFLDYLSASLLQLEVGIHIKVTPDFNAQLVVNSTTPKIQDGQRLFPPLFFVPYKESALLRIEDAPINLSHPFSRWWIETAGHLKIKHPGIFEGLRRNASLSLRYSSGTELPKQVAESLNGILERLRRIEPNIVPRDLALRAKDIRV